MQKALKLPNKLSDLMEVALKDLAKAERSAFYNAEMGSWHQPQYNRGDVVSCDVCFAGSVIAFTLHADKDSQMAPSMFSRDLHGKLIALNSVRNGGYGSAAYSMGFSVRRQKKIAAHVLASPALAHRPVSYHRDRKVFKEDIRAAIRALRGIGE